ncbi:UNVERIFIED_CONTAM: Retrovirus-related Pol polyprotein from transposon.6 [Sesamum radiatum]|uniref:Retrovirus-related Pol polyprotein from transposon.6 n=1 Tax=Sesamum radiatum TaxID=300843 RepID=A0AAW2QHB3_SESRA
MDQEQIQAIIDWPILTTVTVLRAFSGLTDYYHRFVRHYAALTSPLTVLLHSDAFQWTHAATDTFNKLKSTMTTLPVLVLPNFSKSFDLTRDASGVAIGAVLSQGEHPVAFFNKKLTGHLLAASAYTREMYAIIESVKKWRQYLSSGKFTIFTDQKTLGHLLKQFKPLNNRNG